jgi:uncharacterized membrane protein YeaQ/YmgE (transglycosylase-associated protein family)
MALLLFVIFGFFVGLLARAITPGRQRLGLILTTALGIGGSLLGGLVASALDDMEPTRIHASGFIGSLLGALVLLGVARAIMGRRRSIT